MRLIFQFRKARSFNCGGGFTLFPMSFQPVASTQPRDIVVCHHLPDKTWLYYSSSNIDSVVNRFPTIERDIAVFHFAGAASQIDTFKEKMIVQSVSRLDHKHMINDSVIAC